MKQEGSSIVANGGWVPKRTHGRPKARRLFRTSLWLLLPASVGFMGIPFMIDAGMSPVLSVSLQGLCWTAIVVDAFAWLATLVMFLVEKPRDFEMMVENPDHDPRNLY